MKKTTFLKTLLMAVCLLGGVSSVWASTVSDLTSITAPVTITMDGINGTSALADGTLYYSNKLLCLGGNGYSTSKGSTTYGGTTYKNVYQIKNNRQIALKIGFNASITVVGNTNSSRSWRIGTTSAGNDVADGGNNTDHATGVVDGSSTAKVVYINASSDLYLGAIIITSNSSPTIAAPNTASIKATESGVEVTEEIAVTGANLSGSTLTATLSPAVTGLSVTLGSSTITAGAISTTATLHYTQTVNAKGSTTLTLSDGTTTKDVTVNYKSLVVPTVLSAITVATTFDLSKVETGLETIAVEDGYVVLTDAGSEVSFADQLAVSAIEGVGVTWRGDAVQGPLFKFKTAVPGNVTVKFSDVGSSGTRPNRYANVNETRSDVYSNSSGTTVTCSPIAVNAGDVIVKGEQYNSGSDDYSNNQIRVYQIVFTPVVKATIGTYGYATLSSQFDMDFTTPISGLTAYKAASASASTITLEEVTGKVKAGDGLVIKGTAGTYTIPTTTGASTIYDAPSTINMFGCDGSWSTVSKAGSGTNFVLSVQGGKVVFAPVINTDASLSAGQAGLWANISIDEARALTFVFDGEETTEISDVRDKIEEGRSDFFDLQGRRVAQPTKGLYIVNGKKVIIK